MILAAVLHLGYGGLWAGVLASLVGRVTIGRGVGLGLALWVFMQIAVLPFVGWGVFGIAQTPRIAAATLLLHLIYGIALGWSMDRRSPGVVG